ncbi:LacI family DNA-binding transcriptional regulator [Nakamurella leprariae]|uniref:LacI family DNA-binding transcriptional regulator n=1 Tax=Nakamurella leprariae TaxID=2803911 RepID=A0A938YIJ9_9ACTN|nr:LacI family DNA-binding transcriptional regulator [Nakamurella leprariae]MBM9468498.1 LacI family DNA-binding transcriptional regulator [Nakamurella leprariae]
MSPRRPGPSRPSLATVARAVGVSAATVSNAYNRPERLSAGLLQQIRTEAQRQGYAGPDPVAAQLSRGRTDTLGLLLTARLPAAFSDPGAVAFLEGLSTGCHGAGLNLLLISSEPVAGRAQVPGRAVSNAVVDGFVVYSVREDDPSLRQIRDRQLPTVVVDSPAPFPGADWVGPDDRAGARQLAEDLVAMGHRRIGVITAGGGGYSGPVGLARVAADPVGVHHRRVLGIADALAEVGVTDLPIEERPVNSAAAGADALHALLTRCPELTAVCALMDVMALGALDAARARGLHVPSDLTVTGYDDIPQAATAGLSTVHQPLQDKGRVAAELWLSHRPGGEDRRRVLPTHVVVRGSSGPPQAG